MSSSAPSCVRRVNRWTLRGEQPRENFYYEALAFSRHNINLTFDEENMKPEKTQKRLKNAGIGPSTMRVSEWYQESTHASDDPHSRVSDVLLEQIGRHTRCESPSKMMKTGSR